VAAERDSGVAVRVGMAARVAATALAMEAERGLAAALRVGVALEAERDLAAAVRARVEVVAAMAT
jgi:hypothetical protein